jgi:serine/threonine protein kinase
MAEKVRMGQSDDHIKRQDEDAERTLDAGRPLHEIGSHIGGYKLLSILGEGGFGMVYLAVNPRDGTRTTAACISHVTTIGDVSPPGPFTESQDIPCQLPFSSHQTSPDKW